MVGNALEDFVAVLHRQFVQVHHVVDGGSFVPGFGEGGAPGDDVGEHQHGLGQFARLHQLHALLVERVDGGIARAAPKPPDHRHRGLSQRRVRVEQTRHQGVRVGGGSDVGQTDHGLQAAQGVGVAEGLQRLLAVERTRGGGGRRGAQGEGQGRCAGPGAPEERQPRTTRHARTPVVRGVFSLAQSAAVLQAGAGTPVRERSGACAVRVATPWGCERHCPGALRADRREAQSARKPAALWLPSQ